MVPTCCGKRAKDYRREYHSAGGGESWEEGFKCKWCGRIRIPYQDSFPTEYMDAMDAIREAGILFDASLENSGDRNRG